MRTFYRDEENPYDTIQRSTPTVFRDEQTYPTPNDLPEEPLIQNLDDVSRRLDTSTTGTIKVGMDTNTAGVNRAEVSSDIVFWAGATQENRATAPFTVDAAGNLTASSATIGGYVLSGKGAFGGDGSDGVLSVTSGTTTIDLANASLVIKNYTSINVSVGATLTFLNPATTGTVVILKSQGAVTIAGTVDARGFGAAGGAAVASAAAAQSGNPGTNTGTVFTLYSSGNTYGNGGGVSAGGVGGTALSNPTYYGFTEEFIALRGPVLVIPGSGGGSGAAGGGTSGQVSGAGGRGGAGLVIECAGALNFTGTINCSGAVGGDATIAGNNVPGCGGGGGGAPGMLAVIYNTLTANSGTVTITGGTGGSGSKPATGSTATATGGGGAGAGAWIGVGNSGGAGNSPGSNGVSGSPGGGGGGGGSDSSASSVATGGTSAVTSASSYLIIENITRA